MSTVRQKYLKTFILQQPWQM